MDGSDSNSNLQKAHNQQQQQQPSDRFLPVWLDPVDNDNNNNSNNNNNSTQALQTPSRLVNGVGLDYSPLSIEKVEYLARQLEAGIEPYIPSTTMPIGAMRLLEDASDDPAVYNSTQYDNLLYGNTRANSSDLYGDHSHWRQSPAKHQSFPPPLPARVPTPANGGTAAAAANKENADQYRRSLSTPKKSGGEDQADVITPTTIVLSSSQRQHTILRQNTRLNNNNQTPIRAVKTSSFTKLIAEASDTSPAKGNFISRSVPNNVGKAVRSLAGGGPTPTSVATRPMSFSMSSFQVNLSNSSALTARDKSAVSKKKKPRGKRARSASVSRQSQVVIDHRQVHSSHPQSQPVQVPAVYSPQDSQGFQASHNASNSMEPATAQRHMFHGESSGGAQYTASQSFPQLSTPNRDQLNSLFLDMGSTDQIYPNGFSNGPIP